MNIQQIKNIYLANGLNEYKVTNHQDINSVHGINVPEISGYSALSIGHKKVFDEFIINFFNAQGLERRSTLLPESISFVLLKKEKYLRFEYQINGHEEWLHVLSEEKWY